MARLPKARYTRKFKVHAVSAAKDEGLGIAETARRLSIFSKTVANWMKPAQEDQDFAKESAANDAAAENCAYRKKQRPARRIRALRVFVRVNFGGDDRYRGNFQISSRYH